MDTHPENQTHSPWERHILREGKNTVRDTHRDTQRHTHSEREAHTLRETHTL